MANKRQRKKAIKKVTLNKSNPKNKTKSISIKQKEINRQYTAARNALRKRIKRLEQAGFTDIPGLPKIPKTKTEASVRKLKGITREVLIKKSTYTRTDKDTGEIYEFKGKKAQSAYKEDQKLVRKASRKKSKTELTSSHAQQGTSEATGEHKISQESLNEYVINGWKTGIENLPDEYAKSNMLRLIEYGLEKDESKLADVLRGLTNDGYGVNELGFMYKGNGKSRKTLSRFGAVLYQRGLLSFREWMNLDDSDNENGEDYII